MAYLNNVRVFVRVMELGNLSAAGRAMRVSPAVASNRIKELEKHLGVRLFNRTTRKLTPTEQGRIFYDGAVKVLEAVDSAEAAVADISENPRGTIHTSAPLGFGKRIIAPLVPEFHELYPDIEVRLRLSDRKVDLTSEAVDVAFQLGILEDSNLRMRGILECDRVLCAAPAYLESHGTPSEPDDLLERRHRCLLLRFPGSREYYWTLQTETGPRKYEVHGPYDSDDGDVLTEWALAGHGIINKPRFEVVEYLRDGRLSVLMADFPPVPAQLACLYPHKRLQDPKVRVFIDFMAERCRQRVRDLLAEKGTETAAQAQRPAHREG